MSSAIPNVLPRALVNDAPAIDQPRRARSATHERRRTERPATDQLELSIIRDLPAIRALAAEWNALIDANHVNQLAFQSHDWLLAWLETFAADQGRHSRTIAIITARTGGHLRVVCPLVMRHKLGMTKLAWLGEPASQYGDVVTDGSSTAQALIATTLDFALSRLRPDIIHLRKVRADAAVAPWLTSTGALATTPDNAPYLDFRTAASVEDYAAKFSGKSRKNRRRLRRRLEEVGPVTTRVLPPGPAARAAIDEALAFKQQWLNQRGHVASALRHADMSAFLRAIVTSPDGTAKPFVSVMSSAATPVSIQFGLISKRRLALHMIAYNPETEKSGAGVLHIEDTIAHCIESGLIELDFLAPDQPYKRDWADAAMPVHDYVRALSVPGRLYAQGYLCSTRGILKARVGTLPLSVRRNLARHM